ncbi:unnamed protein product [Microthlaspi erraticum]|uniref:Uncharacterized protein n=1 Tax=Microthlaspi erraticum TaxID=1685480 RepID=A0A6D2IPU6_9BRAS|nr:unnamed protein product [Microthlaspi erraticum]
MCFSDSKLDDYEGETEDLLNFVVFVATKNDPNLDLDSESEAEEVFSPKKAYYTLYDNWIFLSQDKLQLTKENLKLESEIHQLEGTSKTYIDIFPIELVPKCGRSTKSKCEFLEKEIARNKERATQLENQLNDGHKKLQMLNSGSQSLDQILGMGRLESGHRVLGYQGF